MKRNAARVERGTEWGEGVVYYGSEQLFTNERDMRLGKVGLTMLQGINKIR